MVGQYHLGDFVNRFRHGSLVMKLPDSEAAKIPTVLFGTINGAIGVIASLPQEQYQFFSKLQVGKPADLHRVCKAFLEYCRSLLLHFLSACISEHSVKVHVFCPSISKHSWGRRSLPKLIGFG